MDGNSLDGGRTRGRCSGQGGKIGNPHPMGLAELPRYEEQLLYVH